MTGLNNLSWSPSGWEPSPSANLTSLAPCPKQFVLCHQLSSLGTLISWLFYLPMLLIKDFIWKTATVEVRSQGRTPERLRWKFRSSFFLVPFQLLSCLCVWSQSFTNSISTHVSKGNPWFLANQNSYSIKHLLYARYGSTLSHLVLVDGCSTIHSHSSFCVMRWERMESSSQR